MRRKMYFFFLFFEFVIKVAFYGYFPNNSQSGCLYPNKYEGNHAIIGSNDFGNFLA
jgi:hypothetical protein